jgi:nitroreductase
MKGNSMELQQAILSRRSIRKFLQKPVPEELINDIIAESLWAPSWGNTQPWEIIVATGESLEEFKKQNRAALLEGKTPRPDIPTPEVWPDSNKKRYVGLGKAVLLHGHAQVCVVTPFLEQGLRAEPLEIFFGHVQHGKEAGIGMVNKAFRIHEADALGGILDDVFHVTDGGLQIGVRPVQVGGLCLYQLLEVLMAHAEPVSYLAFMEQVPYDVRNYDEIAFVIGLKGPGC